MTTYIGDIALTRYNVYSRSHRSINLAGYFTTSIARDQLAELCARSNAASVTPLLMGGIAVQDNSLNKLLIVYCQFDETEYYDGYYIITHWEYTPNPGYVNIFPWTMNLAFIGSGADTYEGYDLGNLRDLTNDWE